MCGADMSSRCAVCLITTLHYPAVQTLPPLINLSRNLPTPQYGPVIHSDVSCLYLQTERALSASDTSSLRKM